MPGRAFTMIPSWILGFSHFRFFSKIFKSHDSYARRGITPPIVYRMSWGFACLQLNPISRGHIFYIENELGNFPGESKIYLKVTVNCRPSITVFFVPGVLLTEGRILSSASYVGRRGKPSTWLPRQKLAEERKKEKETKEKIKIEIFMTNFFLNFVFSSLPNPLLCKFLAR